MSDPVADFLGPDGLLMTGSPTAELVEPAKHPRVAVSVVDLEALRRLRLPPGVRTTRLAVHVAGATGVVTVAARPEWPTLTALRAHRTDDAGSFTVLRFARPVDVAVVVAEMGRQAVWGDTAGHHGLIAQEVGPIPEDVPPDVLLSEGPVESHPVTGREPFVLREPAGPMQLGPLDERILNPTGFDPLATGPVVDLSSVADHASLAELVGSLRTAAGVRVDLTSPGQSLPRTVAALAMAGVPMVSTEVPRATSAILGDQVSAALTAPVDLDDLLAREEHSIVLRRAALRAFSSFGYTRALGAMAGVRVADWPAVSILLASRRPEQVEFALRQVSKQRGVEQLELVYAPHGFEVDPAQIRDLAGPQVSVQVIASPASELFGDVLTAAAGVATGDVVVKMDDDDWYGADAITDLLLARAYSGAELVGMPAEFHYLTPRAMTVKRGHPGELYARFVAGGTLMVERGLLREVGGFRSVHKYVDAQLLAAVRSAGGAVYRTHGLGYLLRRNATGHTWEVDMDYLLDPVRVQQTWEGFRPSRLLEVAPEDLPDGTRQA